MIPPIQGIKTCPFIRDTKLWLRREKEQDLTANGPGGGGGYGGK